MVHTPTSDVLSPASGVSVAAEKETCRSGLNVRFLSCCFISNGVFRGSPRHPEACTLRLSWNPDGSTAGVVASKANKDNLRAEVATGAVEGKNTTWRGRQANGGRNDGAGEEGRGG